MRDITREVGVSTDYEFFWGEPQEALVIFRSGDVVAHKYLKTNTLAGAIREARSFVSPTTHSTPNRKVAHA